MKIMPEIEPLCETTNGIDLGLVEQGTPAAPSAAYASRPKRGWITCWP
jgi:hypothetical protein